MNELRIANDIIPVGEFKTHIAKWLKDLKEHHSPVIITQNGKPAGVLISPEDYDAIQYKKRFAESVLKGLKEVDNGNVFTTKEIKSALAKQRSQRSAK